MVITNNTVIFNGHAIPKTNLNLLLQEDLTTVSMLQLADLFRLLYGVPINFRDYLKRKIELHDKSTEVNSFIYQDKKYWFDKNTRIGLMNLLSCGGDSIQIVLGDEIIEFSSSCFKSFLQALEIYASQCYLTTKKHLAAISKLEKLEDIINYDYTLGYPDKITLSNE